MTTRSTVATNAARDLWSRAAGKASAPEEIAAAAEHVCSELRAGLGRWIGSGGYRALLDRALGEGREDHPALGSLSCHGGEEAAIAAAVREYGAAEVAAGMVALVAALIELLGRIIGEQMALRLVEDTGVPSRRGATAKVKGGRNG